MGKVAKKKHTTNGKPNSRLHRRAASPPLSSTIPTSTSPSLPKSTSLPNPESTSLPTSKSKKPTTISGGITKSKRPSRHQRLRREKGIQRAETFSDRVVKKIDRSKLRGGVRRERRRGWEDVNGDVMGKKSVGGGEKFSKGLLKGEEVEGGKGEGWEDIENDGEEGRGRGEEKDNMDVLGKEEVEGGDGSSDGEMDKDGGGDEVDRGIRMAPVPAAVVEGLKVGVGGVEAQEEEL